MKILLMGSGPRTAWARSLLPPGIPVEEPAPSLEGLRHLSDATPDLLLLVDPQPYTAEDPAAASLPPGDRLRADATRAVFALEVARRAARTVVLAGDAAGWGASLAEGAPPGLPAMAAPAGATEHLPPEPAPGPGNGYLSAMWQAAATGHPPVVVLTRVDFFDGDAPGQPLPDLIEVAGRARIVAYGPYLPLPAGTWKARVWLGFSPDIGRLPFILEADTGAHVSRGFFEVERGGFYKLDLDFVVDDPLHPLELRLISQDSALEGQASLIEVRLEPAQSVP